MSSMEFNFCSSILFIDQYIIVHILYGRWYKPDWTQCILFLSRHTSAKSILYFLGHTVDSTHPQITSKLCSEFKWLILRGFCSLPPNISGKPKKQNKNTPHFCSFSWWISVTHFAAQLQWHNCTTWGSKTNLAALYIWCNAITKITWSKIHLPAIWCSIANSAIQSTIYMDPSTDFF